jgi:phosphoribosyl-AMP cyclohydrolase / phosphoribosyl-ATP pyrophosphohydrolase
LTDVTTETPAARWRIDGQIDFTKAGGMVPAIVQDADSKAVLMLGYMNDEALAKTRDSGLVTFFSRSKNRLWTKGETSGHTLAVVEITTDCDSDAILVMARPHGPTCHTGTATCFQPGPLAFLAELEVTIEGRKAAAPDSSYTAKLFAKGLPKIAQKVGEEASETIVAALAESDAELASESADLIYHLLVLLAARGMSLRNVVEVLAARQK